MGVASRAAKAVDNMFSKSKAELKEIAKGKGSKAMDAEDELDRRQYNKDVKSGRESGPYASKSEYTGDSNAYEEARYKKEQKPTKQEKAADKQAEEFAMGKEPTKRKEAKNLSASEKKDLEESLKFNKGGMVKKKAAPAAKPKSRTNALNKFYGK